MAIQIKHQFVSLKGDGGDATQVQPSYWNAAHSFTLAAGQLVGRLSAGVGAAEEIPISAFMASLLNSADVAALGAVLGLFETGDFKYTLRSAASAGWILMLGGTGTPPNTIGNAASGAALRANADTLALFTVVYNTCSDTVAPVSGGRSGNALNDFNANKTIQIPNPVGRSVIGAGGATASTSARIVGATGGAESVALSIAELAAHRHTAAIYDPTHNHSVNQITTIVSGAGGSGVGGGGAFGPFYPPASCFSIGYSPTGVRVNSDGGLDTTYTAGSGSAHNNMHPFVNLNVMVKL